jgi:putative acyl-CoA dehydrogenase
MTTGVFYQEGPQLGNQYTGDRLLRQTLQRMMPPDVLRDIEPDLQHFGERVITDVAAFGRDALANEPTLTPFDPWGRRIDEIHVAQGWRELKRVSAEEGLVAIGYERNEAEFSRLYQFAKLYLFNPSSAIYTCPLAMTDGAARLLEVIGSQPLKERAFTRLTSRDPDRFWTSGQWMTERTGGSDVSGTETVAIPDGDGYQLHGTKWFTSATTSEMAMTLARIQGESSLSLFYLETRSRGGAYNHIEVHRLKDKLGTRALPTAELSMLGTRATLVGEAGRGVANMSTLFNVTRLYNAVCAASGMRRCMALMRDYAGRRKVFGKLLRDQPLHVETLARMEVEFQGAFQLVFHAIELMGKEDCGQASPDEIAALRLLTPLAKLYTAKQYVAMASETLESFGGAGYVEDTGLPVILRDGQVLSIWEGTTNVLSLDALRAIEKNQSLEALMGLLESKLGTVQERALLPAVKQVRAAAASIPGALTSASTNGPEAIQSTARDIAYALTRTYTAALMLEHAQWALTELDDGRAALAAKRWCDQTLVFVGAHDDAYRAGSHSLAMDL